MENKIIVVVKGVIAKNGKALIVKRSSTEEVDAGSWETVGGKIEFGEVLEEALIREVKEEIGIEVNVGKLLFATTFFTDPLRQIVLLTYLCRTTDDQIKLSDEHSDYKWVTSSELRNYLPHPIANDFKKYSVFETLES